MRAQGDAAFPEGTPACTLTQTGREASLVRAAMTGSSTLPNTLKERWLRSNRNTLSPSRTSQLHGRSLPRDDRALLRGGKDNVEEVACCRI